MKGEKMKEYVSPCMEITTIELEQGIAVGSATAVSGNASEQVQDEWIIETDDSRVIPW